MESCFLRLSGLYLGFFQAYHFYAGHIDSPISQSDEGVEKEPGGFWASSECTQFSQGKKNKKVLHINSYFLELLKCLKINRILA